MDKLTNTTSYQYFGARYYDSDLSVWLSVDPLSDYISSFSPYNYTLSNPIMLVDKEGLYPRTFSVQMDKNTVIEVKISRWNGQKITFINGTKKLKFDLRSSYRSKIGSANINNPLKRKIGLALLKSNTCNEDNPTDTHGDIAKINTEFSGYKVTEILTKLANQHKEVSIFIIGNHAVPHYMYGSAPPSYRRYNNHDYNLYYHEGKLYKYNNNLGLEKNRSFDMDSQFSKDRADYVRKNYFNNSNSVNTYSRYNIIGNDYSGVKLSAFGHDAMGVTIGIKISKNIQSHGNVRYLW